MFTDAHDISKIRNIAIIAHIDHGKSTLADRLIEFSSRYNERTASNRQLDSLELEKERGITIKAHPVTIFYDHANGQKYSINLMDTPGHVDFSYEVSRSLAACDGAVLLIDATQGIQAQTLSTLFLAIDYNIPIIPVINKIDLPAADIENTVMQIKEVLHSSSNIITCSAKTGKNVELLIPMIIDQIPHPVYDENANNRVRALVFDSVYNQYCGVIVYVRIVNGQLKPKDTIFFMSKKRETVFEINELGVFDPHPHKTDRLSTGQIGFIHANIKTIDDVAIGDTITLNSHPAQEPLAGFKEVSQVVFAGIYPEQPEDFSILTSAIYKLRLNDSSLTIHKEKNNALGFGFRCGFLGLLHMEIVTERLKREFGAEIIICSPSVSYTVITKQGESKVISNPDFFPEKNHIAKILEPWVHMTIISNAEHSGSIIQLAHDTRGLFLSTEMLDEKRLIFEFEFPLNEIITDFNDRLKSVSSGYASFNYKLIEERESDIVKLSIKVNDEPADALSMLVYKKHAESTGRRVCSKLKDLIPKSLVRINIQACLEGKIIASEKISALSKNVTAKCYGGDFSRKQKLWNKQKEGKKKMLKTHKVRIPPHALIAVLKKET